MEPDLVVMEKFDSEKVRSMLNRLKFFDAAKKMKTQVVLADLSAL